MADMIPDCFETLAALRAFLMREVLPTVSQSIAGELRAAIKTLEAVAAELNALHPLLRAECIELLGLCVEAKLCLSEPSEAVERLPSLNCFTERLSDNALDAVGLIALHQEIHTVSSALLVELQETHYSRRTEESALAALLARFYTTLGRHAERRIAWQSVFPRAES
ncbi:MAG: hypothetical protein ACREXT_04555 [Gammaproteobacteria bacterium]